MSLALGKTAGGQEGTSVIGKSPILAAMLLGFMSGAAVAGCERAYVSGSSTLMPVRGGFDEALLDRAILAEANYQRCLKDRAPLKPLRQLRGPAQRHSVWMAQAETLSHRSSVAGRRSLQDRISSTGLPVRSAAENLAQIPLYDLTPRFRVIDAASCRFTSPDGRYLGRHSYASFAHKVVGLWMQSPGHRRNLLSRSTSYMAAAAVLDPGTHYCGDIYVTQIFAG